MSLASVRYVTDLGDDTFDGLSWDSPKRTLLAAYDALPTGGGTIYVNASPGQMVEIGGSGLWLCRSGELALAPNPSLWRVLKGVTIEGVGGMGGSGIGTGPAVAVKVTGNLLEPWVWLSGYGAGATFKMRGIAMRYPAISARIGVKPDGDRDGSCYGVHFENCDFKVDFTRPTSGPNVDVGMGYWITFTGCAITGSTLHPPGSDQLAAILCKPEQADGSLGSGCGIHVAWSNFASGGIVYRQGGGGGNLDVRHVTLESDNVQVAAPVVDIQRLNGYAGATIHDVGIADAPAGTPAVRVASTVPAEAVLVSNVGSVEGPCTRLSSFPRGQSELLKTPAAQGQVGFWGHRLVGQHDSSRRQFGPVVVRFPNLAPHDTARWATASGRAIVTLDQPAPDGSRNAAKLESVGGLDNRRILAVRRTVSVGDRIFVGCWINGHGQGAPFNLQLGCPGLVFAESQRDYLPQNPPTLGDGEWEWICRQGVVGRVQRSPADFNLELCCAPGAPRTYFAPVLIHAPAGELSDSEAAEFCQQLQAYPDGAPVGSRAMLRGASLWVPA